LLLRDAIVPTLPTRIGQDDAMNDLGSRVLAEKQSSIPRTLQDGHLVVGVHLEFPNPGSRASPHWEAVEGSAPLAATAGENAAEIGWREGAPLSRYVLASADGQMIANISADPHNGIRVESRDLVSSWPWVGVECAPDEAGRFDWQVLGTASVPTSWSKDEHWLNGRGRRLDLRLPAKNDETVALTLAIVDAATGWALTSKIEHQQKLRR
jgi:hypothetical protein